MFNFIPAMNYGSLSPMLATVTTSSVINITDTGATAGGTVSGGTGSVVTEAGICWDLSPNPTINNSKIISPTTSGSFTVNLTGLNPSTQYYVKAYATNSIGTAYGNEETFSTSATPLVVGQAYEGGFIVYLDGTGVHGIICANQDISSSAIWGCYGSGIATSTSVGTGQSNTNSIVSICGTAGIAARLCNDSGLNGYTDWYLPSKDELALAFSVGIINAGGWWSSSQVNSNDAWALFNGGFTQQVSKQLTRQVRPFRSF